VTEERAKKDADADAVREQKHFDAVHVPSIGSSSSFSSSSTSSSSPSFPSFSLPPPPPSSDLSVPFSSISTSIPLSSSLFSLSFLLFPYFFHPRWCHRSFRDFSSLFHRLRVFEASVICGLSIFLIPLLHGLDSIGLGFIFCLKGRKVLYMSDGSEVTMETREVMERRNRESRERRKRESRERREGKGGGEQRRKRTRWSRESQLYFDCFFRENPHPTHFNLQQASVCIEWIRPDRTVLLDVSDEISSRSRQCNDEEMGETRKD